jgi:hypothetical protein
MEDAKTDQDGRFKIEGMMIDEGVRFSVQARSPKGGNKAEVIIDQPSFPEVSANKNGPDFNDHQNRITRLQNESLPFRFDRSRRLKEVIIQAKKLESIKYTSQGPNQIPEGHADQTFIFTDPDNCPTLGICLQGKIHGVLFTQLEKKNVMNFPHSRGFNSKENKQMLMPMDVYLDGRKIVDTAEMTGIFDNNSIEPSNVGKIEVVRTNVALMGMLQKDPEQGIKAALLIITKRHDKRDQAYTPNIAKFIPKGFSRPREFYSPRYGLATNKNNSDFRSSIYWNTLLIPNKDNILKFDFYTSDFPGNYRVTVEGIDESGHIGRQVFKFKVE